MPIITDRSLIISQKTHNLIQCLSGERRLTFKFLFSFFFLFFVYFVCNCRISDLGLFSLFYCHHENCFIFVRFDVIIYGFFVRWCIGHTSFSCYDKKKKRNPVVLSLWNLARGKSKIDEISGTMVQKYNERDRGTDAHRYIVNKGTSSTCCVRGTLVAHFPRCKRHASRTINHDYVRSVMGTGKPSLIFDTDGQRRREKNKENFTSLRWG